MPQVSSQVRVPVSPEAAFAVSQTHGELRLRWDPFIRSQRFLDGATAPGVGVRTLTHARVGPRMISRYVSYRPPSNVGMTMVSGPWFFASLQTARFLLALVERPSDRSSVAIPETFVSLT